MGYCVDLIESTISITEDNSKKIMNELKEYIIKFEPDWRWVSNEYILEAIEYEDFSSVMEELRYAVCIENNLYEIDYLAGDKLGNDFEVFKLMAPYINNGYIEMHDDAGSKWRWVFKDGECSEVYPKIEW